MSEETKVYLLYGAIAFGIGRFVGHGSYWAAGIAVFVVWVGLALATPFLVEDALRRREKKRRRNEQRQREEARHGLACAFQRSCLVPLEATTTDPDHLTARAREIAEAHRESEP